MLVHVAAHDNGRTREGEVNLARRMERGKLRMQKAISRSALVQLLVVELAKPAHTEATVEKLAAKGCDLILANDVSAGSGTFGGAENTIHLVAADVTTDALAHPHITNLFASLSGNVTVDVTRAVQGGAAGAGAAGRAGGDDALPLGPWRCFPPAPESATFVR